MIVWRIGTMKSHAVKGEFTVQWGPYSGEGNGFTYETPEWSPWHHWCPEAKDLESDDPHTVMQIVRYD